MSRFVGFVPVRMASSRFPGKPLHPICGRPMLEHVFLRARLFPRWDGLYLTTCDPEIRTYGEAMGWPVIMSSSHHTRALDRVAEAARKCEVEIEDRDIVVCVQGDEPMLRPDMIETVIHPLEADPQVRCTVLAMEIASEEQFRNPNTVKIVHDLRGDVLYTSRSPIPYSESFGPELGARRIYGILAFRWDFLRTFNLLPQSPLEVKESCDSNRICDHGFRQRIAPYPYVESFSVDTPEDIDRVEEALIRDPLIGQY